MHLIQLFAAKYLILVVVLMALGYWLTLSKKVKIELMVFGLIAGIVSFMLAKIGASLFYDTRPFVAQHIAPLYPRGADNGFPSDHTLLAAFTAVTIYTSSRRLGIGLMVLAVIIGTSRVIGHIHSPIDIVGSLIFALLGGFVAAQLAPRVIAKLSKNI